jgi:hypothetical protein
MKPTPAFRPLLLSAAALSLNACVAPYYPPPAPAPVVVTPRPVYVAPRPVYVAPRPVYGAGYHPGYYGPRRW